MASGGGPTPRASGVSRSIAKVCALLAAAVAALAVAAAPAGAFHERGLSLSWVRTAPNTARYTLKGAFNRAAFTGTAKDGHLAVGDLFTDFIGGTSLFFGDGVPAFNPTWRVVASNVHDNYVIAEMGHGEDYSHTHLFPPFEHTFNSPGPFTAWSAGCCTIDNLVRNVPGIPTIVDYGVNSLIDLAHDSESPLVTMPLFVTVDDKGVQSWKINAEDAGGQRLRFKLRTGPTNPQLPGAHLDPDTGVMEWNTTGFPDGLYQSSAEVAALDASGNVVSTSEVHYLVRLAPAGKNAAPAWMDPTPPDHREYTLYSGQSLDIALRAYDPDTGDRVLLNHLGLPDGATLNTSEDNPADAAFHWTPKRDQAGDYLVTFTADDSNASARQVSRAVVIHVLPNAAPKVNAGPDQTVDEGGSVTLDGSATTDPENDPLTFRWTRTGGVGPSVGLSSYSAVKPSFQTLDDGRSDFRLSADDGRGGAASDTVSTTTRNVAPTVAQGQSKAYEGGAAVLTTTFTDPGVLDTHTASVDWGDGSVPEPASVTQGSGWGSIVASHRFTQAGTYHATVTVTDDDGGTGTASPELKIVRPTGIWANSSTASPAFDLSGSHNRVTGLIHTNRDVRVTGSDNRAETTEYATVLDIRGATTNLITDPRKTDAAPMPVNFSVASYAPGGSAASSVPAGSYFDLSSRCTSSTSTVTLPGAGKPLTPGVYYAPCNVSVYGNGLSSDVTIAATGTIKLDGSGNNLRPFADGLLFVTSASGTNALELAGDSSTFSGTSAPQKGQIHISGSNLTYDGGIFADRIDLSGSYLKLSASDSSARPDNAVALATLVPTPQLGVDSSSPDAIPGDKLTYRASLANAGATLIASGLFGAQDTGDAAGTVKYYSYTLEYLSAATGKWTPLAGTAAASPGFTPAQPAALTTGVQLATSPMPSAGVAYGSDGARVLDTTLPARSLAAWAYQARLELTPEQVNLLYDPAKVQGIRNHVHLEYSPGSAPIRPLYELGNDFASGLRANSKDITDAHVTLAPPTGDPRGFDSGSTPALARIAPGTAAAVTGDYTVPPLPARAGVEDAASYQERLATADNSVLHGAARSTSSSDFGKLFVPQANASVTQHVPVVSVKESGPAQADAGTSPTYDIDLANVGSARAQSLGVDDAIFGGGTTSLADVPSGLDPGQTSTAHATRALPVTVRGGVIDRATARWQDANGNAYGPAEDHVTTDVRSAASVKASKRAQLAVDADGNGVVSEGDTLAYTVTLTNRDGSAATSVVFNDTIDPNTTLVAGTLGTSQGTVKSSGPIKVDLGSIAGGASATITFRARIPDRLSDGVVGIRNQGTITTSDGKTLLTDDPDSDGPADPTLTAVHLRAPHVEATETATLADDADANGKPSAGDTLEYHATVENAGDAMATGVRLVDPIGAHLSLVAGSAATDAGRVTSGSGSLAVAFDQMQPLTKAHVTWRARVDDVLPLGVDTVSDQGFVVSNETGHAKSYTDDPDAPGDNDPTLTKLTLVPRLEATKTATLAVDADGNGVASPGDSVRYDIRVANTSGTAASGVKLTDTPDSNTSVVAGSASATGGTVAVSGSTVTGTIGALAVGDSASVSFQAKLRSDFPAGIHQISNQGTVTSDQRPALRTDDPGADGGANPTVTPVVLTSGPAPALAATKTATLADDADGNHLPSPGDTLSYEVKVSNVGAGTASGVRLADVLDTNTELVAGSVQAPAGTTVATGNGSGDASVDVALGHVAPGTIQTLTFQAKVAGAIPPGVDRVRNQGQVTSDELGPVLTQDPGGTAVGGATETAISPPPKPAPAIHGIAPADGSVLTAPTPVTADLAPPTGQSIDSWCVRYELSGSDTEHTLRCGTGAPSGSTLATLDPTTLPNGSYTVTIEATASGGGEQSQSFTVSVKDFAKPARMRLSYQDLSIPAFDLPLQVTRTYDSFDKEKGDFGVGWNAEISGFRVQVNRPLGRTGWSFQQSGCRYLLGSNFCTSTDFKDLSAHYVTVTWPDGHDEVFDFTPHAGDAGVYYDATVGFTARKGSSSALEALDGGTSLVYWGAGRLFESDGETPYDPQRFKLTAKDGTVYVLSRDKGLETMTDPHGNVLTVDSAGVRVKPVGAANDMFAQRFNFTRDSEGRITQITGPANLSYSYGYDAAGNLASATDGNGKKITYEYDADHNITKLIDPDNHPFQKMTYDENGRLASVSDGDGHTSQVDTSDDGSQETLTDPAGRLTTVLRRDENGDVVQKQELADGETHTTSYEYDDNGNVTRTVDPLGHETKATYDGAGNRLTATDGLQRTVSFDYDGHSRLMAVTRPDGTSAIDIERNVFGDPTRVDEGLGRATNMTYDPRGSLIGIQSPSGNASISYEDSGVPYLIVSPVYSALIGHDQANRLTVVNDNHNGRTDYTYDLDGNLTKRAQQPSYTVRYTYDYAGRQLTEADAFNRTRKKTYDNSGRLKTRTNRSGQTTSYDYDADGRMVRRNLPDGRSDTQTYDGFGRTRTMENRDANLAFGHDAADRVTTLTTASVSGSSQPTTSVDYDFDAANQLISSAGPGGVARYGYDARGYLESLVDTDGGRFGFDRDDAGRPTGSPARTA